MIAQTNTQAEPSCLVRHSENARDFNVNEYLVDLIPKPISDVNGKVDKYYDIHGNPIKPLVEVSCEKELNTKRMIMRDLLTNNYNPDAYDVKFEHNNKYIKDVFTMISSLPKIMPISQTKPFEPIFNEIEVLKTDSAELKKFLRKMNVQFVGYYCDHNAMNEKCDKVVMSTSELLESEDFEKYKEFIERYANCIYDVFCYYWYDMENNNNHESLRSKVNEFHIDYSTLLKLRCCITRINTKIFNINSSSNKRCSKCEAKQRLYEYTLREVQRMRAEQEEIDRQFDESDYDLAKFMQNNYPNIDRLLLKDVQQRYAKEFGQKLTFAELTDRLEQTGKWKITNVHRTQYVNRV